MIALFRINLMITFCSIFKGKSFFRLMLILNIVLNKSIYRIFCDLTRIIYDYKTLIIHMIVGLEKL